MPEGDTIHRVAGLLEPRLTGATIRAGRLRDRPSARLEGRKVTGVTARGKHLLIALDDDRLVRSHLGMHGSWHRYAPGERWRRPERQASLVIETGADVFVCFNAKEVEVMRARSVGERLLDERVGPDLLDPSAFPPGPERTLDSTGATDVFRALPVRARALLDADAPVADILLDQRVASGIGNVYKSEVPFLERVHPATPLGAVADATLVRLYETARDLLRRNARDPAGGPRRTRFKGDDAGRYWAYKRGGQACHECGATIAFARLGRLLRSTYWCPDCQPAPSAGREP